MNQTLKKVRSKNFTPEEVETLLEEVAKRRGLLFGPLKGGKSAQFHREQAWERVTMAVNEVGPVVRTIREIRRKYKDYKNRSKRKIRVLKKENEEAPSNDGDPLAFEDMEDEADQDSLIGSASTSIEGFDHQDVHHALHQSESFREKLEKAVKLQQDQRNGDESKETMKELLLEFRDFKNQFLAIKRRELQIMEENLKIKKKYILS